MEHLALEIFDLTGTGSQFAFLPDNTTITITRTSRIFGKGDVWSYDFQLNVMANAHIFGTTGALHGGRLHEQLHRRRARLWVEGLPLFLGYLKLADEVDVDEDGDVTVKFESGQKTFENLIDGAKANQVPLMSDVPFGLALWRKRYVRLRVNMSATAKLSDGRSAVASIMENGSTDIELVGEGENTPLQQYPRMVYPTGTFLNAASQQETFNYLNVDTPYDSGHPYCNVALCYQKQGYPEDKAGTVDYGGTPEAKRGYDVMPAKRINSAPNFYVIYWVLSLMKHLNIRVDENQMMDVEDLRRLFFVNTNCAYEVPEKLRTLAAGAVSSRYGRYKYLYYTQRPEYFLNLDMIDLKECGFKVTSFNAVPDASYDVTVNDVDITVTGWNGMNSNEAKDYMINKNVYLHKAYATSECFPNEDISKVIEALENAFGIRFVFDDDFKRVRIVLLRNVFRDQAVQELTGDIISQTKTENSIRGFRMTYGQGTENTEFYYKLFGDKLSRDETLWPDTSDKHDYSQWQANAVYSDVIHKASAFNKKCYVTPNTGNSYGVKDQDTKRFKELYPSIYEYAGYMDAEDGDCTGGEGTVKELNVGFTPAIMNDLNMEAERQTGIQLQQFALFVDEDMRPRRFDMGNLKTPLGETVSADDPEAIYPVYIQPPGLYSSLYEGLMKDGVVQPGLFDIKSDMYAVKTSLTARVTPAGVVPDPKFWNITMNIEGYIYEGYRLYLQDNYEPNDDGVSPIETHDWGLTLGIMRGSGSDAHVKYGPDFDDGEGNETWDIIPGSNVTAHPDTCDNYGNQWDYNGGTIIDGSSSAKAMMHSLFPNSNFDLTNRNSSNYLTRYLLAEVVAADNTIWKLLFAAETADKTLNQDPLILATIYVQKFRGKTLSEMFLYDRDHRNLLIEVGSNEERAQTLIDLQYVAYDQGGHLYTIDDNGIGSIYGRFSLKLRAEKPNPDFDPTMPENDTTNRRYLQITNPELRRRGLMDQFHKEESYWWRNARIMNVEMQMGIAQLIALDDTRRMHVGDVTGLMKTMQFSVTKQTGLQPVKMEIFYL